jgi:hypothetical protein
MLATIHLSTYLHQLQKVCGKSAAPEAVLPFSPWPADELMGHPCAAAVHRQRHGASQGHLGPTLEALDASVRWAAAGFGMGRARSSTKALVPVVVQGRPLLGVQGHPDALFHELALLLACGVTSKCDSLNRP